ncbi:uncharacterized protein LOC9633474 [Selaginella moellendorffii]|uniref:uncharacterized protein LOC9633474 n=1 Tax=Selaginella moellendorffii TaxID=88036 RepID=UPI000D1CBDC3|nr:uncharacterized protein LOC9633474 [Selaginella moellendorffii]|eukprot:XP_024531523.1 uncharacterized protein LOC9633474 [Selaginella moellendorffii]
MASWVVASLPVFVLLLWAVLHPAKVTHYKVLGLRGNASSEEIQAAYTARKSPLDTKVDHAFYVLSDAYRRRVYDHFGLDSVESEEAALDTGPILSRTPRLDDTNFKSVLESTTPCLIQIFSDANTRSREFSPVWERLAEVLEGQVNLLRVEIGEVQLAKLLAGKRWIRRHGIPSLVAKPPGCRELKCLIRYSKGLSYDSILDWIATLLLDLPRIRYFSSQNLIPEFIQKSGPHKVKVILFSDTGERALPFVREAAKKYSEFMSFGCVLWRQEEASIWKSRLGLELAPAVVFIKDPGVQPIIVYGKLTRDSFMETVEEHKVHVLPQLRSITASKLGCDPADFSAAGKDVETWYCVVVAGRPGFQLDQLRSTMRIVQDELGSEDIDGHNFAAATAYKDKRLSLSWLDGEMQKKFCYYCLPSETVHETCGPRQYQEQDVARIFMIRFRRDPNHQKPVVKRINTWWRLDDEEQDLASMLIAPYSGANEISEVLSWISNTVRDGDTNEIPFFNTKSVPALIPEEQAVSMLSSTRNAASGMRRSLIDKVNSLVVDLMDFITDWS